MVKVLPNFAHVGHIFIYQASAFTRVSNIHVRHLDAMMIIPSCDPHSIVNKLCLSDSYVFINSDAYNILHLTEGPMR